MQEPQMSKILKKMEKNCSEILTSTKSRINKIARWDGLFGRDQNPLIYIYYMRRFLMAFKPLHDRVVVRRVDSEDKTSGGLIIPDSAQEKPAEGEVVSVGTGARDDSGKLIPMELKSGDKILFGKWSGTEVKIDGEELLIMKESDILGLIS